MPEDHQATANDHPSSTVDQIAFVYFDVDDTLLDHRQAERNALADVRTAFPEAFEEVTTQRVQEAYHAHNKPLWERYADGEIEKEELKRLRFEQLLETLAIDSVAPHRVGAHYIERYTHHWAAVDGALDAFRRIADYFPVGLLTNGFSETQHAKIERFPVLEERSDVIVVSEETGYLKPDPRVFAHAAEAAGFGPASLLYVGNSLRSDVKGGLKAGWQVAWYTPHGLNGEATPESDWCFRFQHWDELLDRLL